MSIMSIKLIAFDLDGTILNRDHEISERSVTALKQASEQGIHIVPATGRSYSEIPINLREQSFIRYVITMNGAQVYDTREKKVLHRAEIAAEKAVQLVTYMDTLPVIYECLQEGRGWMDRTFYDRIDEFIKASTYRELLKNTRTPVENLRDLIDRRNKPVQKLQMFFKDLSFHGDILRTMPEKYPDMAISASIGSNIEINSKEASKGNALCVLCNYLNLDVADTIAFGDGLNDISMLRMAGIGVAMANSVPEILEISDAVTENNDSDGVALAIEKYVYLSH